MESGGHFANGTRYGTDAIAVYAGDGGEYKHGAIGEAFYDPFIAQSLRTLVHGKRVLDIGCGVGNWCCLAAQYGAAKVDGFDAQEEMVKLAKQATSHLDHIHIQVGDVADMPYDDASFDVAISLFVTCNLSPDAYAKHFHELYRVLVPGGKVIFLVPTDDCNTKLYTKIGTDPATVEKDIKQILAKLPKFPTTAQVTKAFQNDNDIYLTCFAVDTQGDIFHIKNISQLSHGQPIWRHTEVMIFPSFFYSDQSTTAHILAAGLHIDNVKNYFTEERRVIYNSRNPKIYLHKECVENPLVLAYYVSKPAVK